jgi:hypothetical protein
MAEEAISQEEPQDESIPFDREVEATELDEADTTAQKEADRAFAEQRRKLKAAEKKAAELEAKLNEKQRAEAEAEGRYKELYEEERAARELAERQAEERERRDLVTQLASDLGFRNPTVAHRLLDDEDTVDATVTERALKALAKKEPYLLQEQPSRTAAPAGSTVQESDDPQLNAARGLLDAINRVRS